MSNLDTNKVFVIQMPISQNYHILVNRKDERRRVQTIMAPITEEEELEIDKGEGILLTRGIKFSIAPNDIYCYGEIDFSKPSTDDMQTIDDFDFLDYLLGVGIKIKTHYDYTTHTCTSDLPVPRWSETWSPAVLARYAHAALNKPKRVIIFKRILHG